METLDPIETLGPSFAVLSIFSFGVLSENRELSKVSKKYSGLKEMFSYHT